MVSERAASIIEAAKQRAVTIRNPILSSLNCVGEFRPGQVVAIKEIMAALDEVDIVVLDAPTGSGKTMIAEAVRRLLKVSGIYCCHSIALQEQVARDFAWGQVLKGRSNYTPSNVNVSGWAEATCADCSGEDCNLCTGGKGNCPYEVAKKVALGSPLCILNTSYFLTEGNGPGGTKGRPFVIADECDTLESELMRYVGVEIGRRTCVRYGISEPRRVTVASSWREWFRDTIKRLGTAAANVSGNDLRAARQRALLERLVEQLRRIEPQVESGWVYTGKDGYVSFKPVKVDEHAKKYWWGLGRSFLLMSATVVSPGQMLQDLGYDGAYRVVRVPSSFPVENRRIKVMPRGNLSKRAQERDTGNGGERANLVRGVVEICRSYPERRILVHAVSYVLTGFIVGELRRQLGPRTILSYTSSGEKGSVLAGLERASNGIIVAPSMDRGVDLPDDLCRVIIVAKVPYPYLGDRQVNARLYGSKGGRVWYSAQTVRSIVQMTGRGVRHADDWCVSYILDSQFSDLWNKSRSMFPQWWVQALDWSNK
jgi:ATP-dependent DNA helicase DinG